MSMNLLSLKSLLPLMVFFTINSFFHSPENVGGENTTNSANASNEFPTEIVNFKPYGQNPIFSGTGKAGNWDEKIRIIV